MIVTDWSDAGSILSTTRCAAALGVFDGVHRGHLGLISRVVDEPGVLPVAVTFRNHPASLLAPTKAPALLMTLRQRLEAFEKAGVGACVLIDFTAAFQRLAGSDFLSALSRKMNLAKLVVGFNFRCGYKMEYGVREIGAFYENSETTVEVADAVLLDGEPVSSSRLRGILGRGELDEFARVSGREFQLDVRDLFSSTSGETTRVAISSGRIAASGQAVPAFGTYRGIAVDDADLTEIDLQVASNYLEGPLAASLSLLYIIRK